MREYFFCFSLPQRISELLSRKIQHKGGQYYDNEKQAGIYTADGQSADAMIKIEESQHTSSPPSNYQMEMFTVKECAQQISGLSEHTVCQSVLQNKLPHFRTVQSKRGKILALNSALL